MGTYDASDIILSGAIGLQDALMSHGALAASQMLQQTTIAMKRPAPADTASRQRLRLNPNERQPSSPSDTSSSVQHTGLAAAGTAVDRYNSNPPYMQQAGGYHELNRPAGLTAAAEQRSHALGGDDASSGARFKTSSRFRGVCWNKKNSRWQAAINTKGRYLYLGLYTDEVEAAKTYDIAAIKLQGPAAKLNFNPADYFDHNGSLVPCEHIDNLIAAHEHRVIAQKLAQEQASALGTAEVDSGNRMELENPGLSSLAAMLAENLVAAGAAGSSSGMQIGNTGAAAALAAALAPTAATKQQHKQNVPTLAEPHQQQRLLCRNPGSTKPHTSSIRNHLAGSSNTSTAPAPPAAVPELMGGSATAGLLGLPAGLDPDLLLDQAAARIVQLAAGAAGDDKSQEGALAGHHMVLSPLGVEAPLIPNLQQLQHQIKLPHQQQQTRQQQEHLLADALTAVQTEQLLTQLLASAAAAAGARTPGVDTNSPCLAAAAGAGVSGGRQQQQQQGDSRSAAVPGRLPDLNDASPHRDSSRSPAAAAAAAATAAGPRIPSSSIQRPIISIRWLLKHIPDDMVLEHVLPGPGSMCGMLYCSEDNKIWGTSVWDGAGWHEVGLYASETEAREACTFVLDVGNSGFESDGDDAEDLGADVEQGSARQVQEATAASI